MSIFRPFELLVFIPQKGVFSFQNIVKEIYLAYIALKIKLEKGPFLDQNHGLTPLQKCQIFDCLNFFLYPRNQFFRSRISKKTFSWPIFNKKKKLQKWLFWDQNHQFTPLKNSQFFDLLNCLFLQPRKPFYLFQNIDIFLTCIA